MCTRWGLLAQDPGATQEVGSWFCASPPLLLAEPRPWPGSVFLCLACLPQLLTTCSIQGLTGSGLLPALCSEPRASVSPDRQLHIWAPGMSKPSPTQTFSPREGEVPTWT